MDSPIVEPPLDAQSVDEPPLTAASPAVTPKKQSNIIRGLRSIQSFYRGLLALLPGTRHFKRTVWRRMALDIAKYRDFIQSVVPIMAEVEPGRVTEVERQELMRKLVHYEKRMALYRSITAQVDQHITVLMRSLIPLFFISAIGWNWLARRLGYQGSANYPVAIPGLVILVILVKLVDWVNRISSYLQLRGFLETLAELAWPLVVALGSGYAAYQAYLLRGAHLNDLSYFSLIIGLAFSGLLIAWFYGLLIPQSLLRIGLEQLKNNLHPEAVFVHSLLMVLVKSFSTREWENLNNRRELLTWLETGATCLEKYLPRHLESFDLASDAWFQDRTREIAAGLRSLKKWVLLPRLDTPDYFVERVMITLREAALGDWDALPREKPETLTRPKQAGLLITSLLRTGRILLSAAGPLLILWGLQQTSFALSEDTADYFALGGIAWAAVTVLIWIDPTLKEKLDVLSAFKKLRE